MYEDVTIKELPDILVALGQKFETENVNVTAVLTVLAIALMSNKDDELYDAVIEYFFRPDMAFEEVKIENLPSILIVLGHEFLADNPNVAAMLTFLALALVGGKDVELRNVVMDHFFNPNTPLFNELRIKELRQHLRVIK